MAVMRLQGVGWAEHLNRLLFLTYSLFLVGFFYVPNAVDLYKFYSVAVLVPALLLSARAYSLLRGNRLFLTVLAYLAYMLLTPAWGEDFQWPAYLNYLRLALYVLVFLMATVLLRCAWPEQFELMLRVAGILAAGSALISLALWFQSNPAPYQRVIGIGIWGNPNASGYAHAVFAVLNLAYVLRDDKPWQRVVHLLAAAVLFWFVLMTHSRGALLGAVAAALVLFIGWRPRSTILAAAAVGMMVVVVHNYFPQVYAALGRGIGARPDIWEAVLSRIAEAPIWGHGYLTDQQVHVDARHATFVFAHNAYLATLRDGGAIGGLLLLVTLGLGCWQALRIGKGTSDYTYPALMVLALVCMFFDTDRLLTRPRELWLLLWLPLGLIMYCLSSLPRMSKKEEDFPAWRGEG